MPITDEQINHYICNINKFTLYSRDCSFSMGGIRTVLIYDFDIYHTFTEDLDKRISSFETAVNYPFLKLDLLPNSAKYTEVYKKGKEGYFWDNSLDIIIDRKKYDKRYFIEKIKSHTFIFFIQDANSRWWFLGEESGFMLQNATTDTGKDAGDYNGYSLSFKNQSTFEAKEVLQSVIDVLFPISDCSIWAGIPMQNHLLTTVQFCLLSLKQPDFLG